MQILRALQRAKSNLFTEAHIEGKERSAFTRRQIIFSSLAFNIVANLIGGTYLTGFCLAIGGDPNYVNTIVLLLSLCNLAQLISPFLLERLQKRKKVLLLWRSVSYLISLFFLPLLALLGLPKNVLLVLCTVFVCLAQLITALVNPGIQAWHIGSIPLEKRLGYFSLNSMINNTATFGVLFLAGLLSDKLGAWVGLDVAMPILRLLTLFVAVVDIFLLSRADEPAYPLSTQKLTLGVMFRGIRSHPEYLRIIGVAALWNFTANIPSQYYNTYMLGEVKVGYAFINAVTLYNIVAVFLFTRFWKQFISRYTLRGSLFLTILIHSIYALGLAMVTPNRIFLYPLTLIFIYNFSVGINISFAMVPYIDLPEENRTVYLSLYNTCCAAATLPGILFGRGIFSFFNAFPLRIGGQTLAPARIIMFVMIAMYCLCAFVTRHLLKDQKAESTA